MGSWDAGIWENDDAIDYLARLRGVAATGRSALISGTLETTASTTTYLEIDAANEAIAAAACVAIARGDRTIPSALEIAKLLDGVEFGAGAVADAQRALDRVVSPDSEFAELWNIESRPNEMADQLALLRGALDPK